MVATLVNEILHAQASLSRLTIDGRRDLITRILDELKAHRKYGLAGVPADRCLWIDRLIASVSSGFSEIIVLEDDEFSSILKEFRKLMATLEEISSEGSRPPVRH